jgi:geranylgeranylglycerol-phosphate geranylgeranyltransferase
MNQLRAAAALIRLSDVALIALLVVVGGAVVIRSVTLDAILAAVSTACIAAGGYAINDWHDVEIDRINKPHRPIPSGRIHRTEALTIALLFQAAGIGFGLLLNAVELAFIGVAVLLVNLYSFRLRSLPLVGNVTTAGLLTLGFLIGGIASGARLDFWTLPAVVFLGNLAREMIKDIEDIPGDRQHQVQTLAVLFGPRAMAVTAALLFVAATALLFDPSLITSFSMSYLWLNVLVVTPMSLIMAVRVSRSRGASAAWARGWSKAIFGMMMVAVICGMVRLN